MNIGSESMFVLHQRSCIYMLRSTPLGRAELAYGDLVICKKDGSTLRFLRLHKKSEFSTFRVFRRNINSNLMIFRSTLDAVQTAGCGVTAHWEKGVAAVTVPKDISLEKTVNFVADRIGNSFFIEISANRQ